MDYSPKGHKASDTTERLGVHTSSHAQSLLQVTPDTVFGQVTQNRSVSLS